MPIASFGLSLLLLPTLAAAQTEPPSTDIFLVALSSSEGSVSVSSQPLNATDRRGYDNQPHFLPDGGSFLYTSHRDGQTDIYEYEIAEKTSIQRTATPESEYSPTLLPDEDFFSVVRVEADGAQRLWKFPRADGEPELLLPDIKPVGYHAWVSAHRVALFILGEPPTLQLGDLDSGQAKVIVSHVGRSLHPIPKQASVSFLHKLSEESWLIKRLDVATGDIQLLAPTEVGIEDYAWTPSGQLVRGRGSKLEIRDLGPEEDWRELADLGAAGIEGITRLAVSPGGDRIAFVASASP